MTATAVPAGRPAAPMTLGAAVAVPGEGSGGGAVSEKEAPKRRGPGRNLPAAIAVGLVLVAVVLVSLFVVPQAFPVLVGIAMVLAGLELVRALGEGGLRVPPVPLLVGIAGIVVSTVVLGPEGLLIATAAAVCVIILWRVTESMGLSALRDVTGGVFALAWVAFLGSFILLLHDREGGAVLVLLAIFVPVGNDVGGYISGVLFGSHPMAPSISPKKSWEGFAGSLVLGTGIAIGISVLALDLDWWIGAVLGVVLVVISTCGDLAESLLKRDLGIKDMGHLLPGHGGVLDRIDSILLAAPTTFILLEVLLP
ncbi:phosphatidate cytidylyltransferase [Brachybacterium squillarum]|uniref:phosphatidate cytidylyltransferase n=1 Tax=Brachybacterium squillarum TaxID=661979 RepID=UPI002221FB46|nr:phosphatidate cytidylyltransferase [Brachybacterium squillarum]MCW1805211.1 phosphatidate cytidylyltransferase [Brachybacterium squillarum]